jgi:hypothetical protein
VKKAKKPKLISLPRAGVELVEVENPNWRPYLHGEKGIPRRIMVEVNTRESAIATLAQKGLLDPAQVAAADRFRALWEKLGGRRPHAIDYGRERVDGGGLRDPIEIAQLDAGRELKRCRLLLGEYGYNLVRLVAGERRSLHEICGSRRERESTADHLRIDLTALATMWGFQTRGRKKA